MASDDSLILALSGFSGLASGIRDVLVPVMLKKYESRLALEQKEAEQKLKPRQKLLGISQDTGEVKTAIEGEPGQELSAFTIKPTKIKPGFEDLSQAQQNAAFKLADDYTKASGEFPKMRDFYNRINASAKDPSAAGDLALIFNYMKLLDPTSVVREGEFATAQNSGSIPDIIQARYNKVLQGERLSDNIRSDFVDRSSRIYKSALRQQDDVVKQFTKRAERFGVPTDLVITDYSAVTGREGFIEPQEEINAVPTINGATKSIQPKINARPKVGGSTADDILKKYGILE